MWFCADCGEEFTDPVKAVGPDGGEETDTCPSCGSDDIEDCGSEMFDELDDDDWDDGTYDTTY